MKKTKENDTKEIHHNRQVAESVMPFYEKLSHDTFTSMAIDTIMKKGNLTLEAASLKLQELENEVTIFNEACAYIDGTYSIRHYIFKRLNGFSS